MTRGTLFLICDTLIIETIEFNGDMYPDGHGQEVIKALEEVETANEFTTFVEKFNKENHNYQTNTGLTLPRKRDFYMKGNKVIMTEENYFEKFGSDWTFWKNISDKPVQIKTKDSSKLITLLPNEQVAINYGHYEDNYKSLIECNSIIEKREKEHEERLALEARTKMKSDLYFRNGTSDKEYRIRLEQVESGFVVNFQYGRRGTTLKSGTKTPTPVAENMAKYIFNELQREKIRKGYR